MAVSPCSFFYAANIAQKISEVAFSLAVRRMSGSAPHRGDS
jgi:hypothetical protein